MNPSFRFRFLRKTVLACSQAIGPRDLNIPHLDETVLNTLEHQLKFFPFWHRLVFLLGLSFLEWGMWFGGWGLIPLRFLSPQRAEERIMILSESRIHPLRFFIHGLKVLICLAAYTHPKVEAEFGFERRRWRENRVKLKDHLEWSSQNHFSVLPSPPQVLIPPSTLSSEEYLKWNVMDALPQVSLDVDSSPFEIRLNGEIIVQHDTQTLPTQTHSLDEMHSSDGPILDTESSQSGDPL